MKPKRKTSLNWWPIVGFTSGIFVSPRIRRRRTRGAAVLEFALVVPILFLVLLGIIEYGWLAKNNLAVANATREGARAAAVGKTIANIQKRIIDEGAPTVPSECTTSSDSCAIKLESSADDGVTWDSFPADDITATPPVNGVQPGRLIRVTVRVRHRPLTPFPGLQDKYLETAVVMRREQL